MKRTHRMKVVSTINDIQHTDDDDDDDDDDDNNQHEINNTV